MKQSIVRVEKEHLFHESHSHILSKALVHTVCAPLSFATWIASPDCAHIKQVIDKKIIIYKKHGGIEDVTYEFRNKDFKKEEVIIVYKSPELCEIRVKIWDAWNAVSTNAHIDFKVVEKRE